MKFSDLGLSDDILRAVGDAGYETPTPIQEQAIPIVLQGRDVLGCAQTGTGKTAAFTLPMVDILSSGRARARMPRSLILEPTRELATQVGESFETYGKYTRLTKALLIGGVSFDEQEKLIDRGVDVLIATPGRLLDHVERGKVLLSDIKILVIDEADRMLDMGFIPDVERIVALIPRIRQTLFFSATMPPEIRRLADAFLINAKEISVAPPASPADTVEQTLIWVDQNNKREALRRLIRSEDVRNALIFCNRKRDVDILNRSLSRHGLNVAALHGDMAQELRTETLERFKRGDVQLLVCSDVAARGIDIQFLSHVFNFDVPHHADDYIHRIGRTGRAGRRGRSITLATTAETKAVAAIERLIKREIPRQSIADLPAPSPSEAEAAAPGGRRGHGGRSRRGRADYRREAPPALQASQQQPVVADHAESPSLEEKAERAGAEVIPVTAEIRERHRSRNRSRDHRRRDESEPDEPIVGMGDHVPAFLMRTMRFSNR
ncbi:MAG TPA: DEAD/DEAH box helicase [Alphaproteobacteria bacterium]|nr:DEAD/DEAH box helicase [Alphaproteobacteria bacterium]